MALSILKINITLLLENAAFLLEMYISGLSQDLFFLFLNNFDSSEHFLLLVLRLHQK